MQEQGHGSKGLHDHERSTGRESQATIANEPSFATERAGLSTALNHPVEREQLQKHGRPDRLDAVVHDFPAEALADHLHASRRTLR